MFCSERPILAGANILRHEAGDVGMYSGMSE